MADEEYRKQVDQWEQWSRYVLQTLERFENRLNDLDERIRGIETEQVVQKTKLALYGAIAGVIVVVGMELFQFFTK